jgi:DNA polymerase-3 subunit delta'
MVDAVLSRLTGQPVAAAFLRGVVSRGRYANAYLFHGPAGVGKFTAALAFARAILCRSTPAEAAAPGLFAEAAPEAPDSRPGDDACGTCAACRKSGALSHPDLKLLFPVTGEEKELESYVAGIYAALRDDPLYVFRYEKADSIRLVQTRELLRELAFRPFESSRRVVVVRDADRMREDQYSALLKSIEEPGASTVWVLTTARLSRVPATIRSRCQRVRFAPLAESRVLEILGGSGRAAPEEVRLAAALSSGSLSRALDLCAAASEKGQGPAALRDQAMKLLEPALAGDPAALWATAQKFMNYGRTGRDALRRMVEFHQLWLRDLLRLRYQGDDAVLVHADRGAELRRGAASLDATEARRRLMVLEELLRAIDGNVAPDAAVFSAMARLAGQRLGEGEWPRHASARWNY